MHQTKNNLQLKVRTQIVGILQDRLADCIDLMSQGKQAHWKSNDRMQLSRAPMKMRSKVNPRLDPLRDHPRFQKLIQRIALI